MKRMSSGNGALDEILTGGFPRNSTNLIMGMPGAGKTVLAQSILFHNATPQARALFITTVSEPLDRMLYYVQEFTFFDEEKVAEAIIYEDLSETLRSEGLVAAFERIVTLVKEHGPALLVIDSFKALHDFAESRQQFRVQLSRLSSVLTSLVITSFFVGEYETPEIPSLPEFAVADCIIELVVKKMGARDVRYLRVVKLRGSTFLSGEHAFRVSNDGLELFPRLRTPEKPATYEISMARNMTGVPALDDMLHEGLWKGSSTLIFGPPGSGKTLLGLHFIFKGIEMGEKGLIATMQENPTQLQRILSGYGWDLEEAISSGMLTLLYLSPVEIYIDEFVSSVTRLAAAERTQRLLIDSVNDLQNASGDAEHFNDFMYSLNQTLTVAGVTSLMTHEVSELFATTVLSRHGISHISDNVVLLHYVRESSQIKRALSVIKTRGSDHDPGIREFTISSKGLVIGKLLDNASLFPSADGG